MTFADTATTPMLDLYEGLAPVYDRLHSRWLRLAGGQAQSALEAALRTAISSRDTFLDAGCGTGAMARRLIAEGLPEAQITLLDPSREMLARTADLAVPRVRGRLENMPFQSAAFDVVNCAWALETVDDPACAIAELCRVLRPTGTLCLAFCADRPAGDPVAWLTRRSLEWRGTGRFLDAAAVASALSGHGMRVSYVPVSGPVACLIARRAHSG